MLEDRTPKRKWPRTQRFALSPKGTDAETSYRSTIVASRSTSGRGSYDDARKAWAASFNVEPDDGMFLGEVAQGRVRFGEIVEAVESSGKSAPDTRAALERLMDAGLIAPPTEPQG